MSLVIDALTLHAAGRELVSRLTLTAQAGERWCVIGRNAVGKSTLLRALAGLGVPGRGGSARWVDAAAAQLSHAALAYLPQAPADRFALSVREWLALHRRAAASPGDENLLAPATALDVAHLLPRAVTQLSGGERQRVGLAAVAVQDARLWLLDEPVSFQDPAHQGLVARWLRAQPSRCLLMSAHDIGWVQQVATHVVALMGDGSWRCGAVDEVLDAATLERTFGCAWRRIEGRWVTA